MVSGPFNWHTVGPSMAIERCLNARAYVNIAARFSHLLQLCITQGDDRYLEQDNAPCHGDRIIQECIVQDTLR